MTQVIKVTKSGYDAISETDVNNFIFDSSLNTFKILAEGLLLNQSVPLNDTTISIAHNQDSIPTFLVFAKFPDGKVALPFETDYTFTINGVRRWYSEIDDTNLDCVFFKTGLLGAIDSDTGFWMASSATDNSGRGTITWAQTGDAITSNNSYATATFTGAADSHYLWFTAFGYPDTNHFMIPTDATIKGIEVVKEGHYTRPSSLSGISYAQLIKAGSVTGDIKSGNFPLDTDGEITHGGSTDMWGLTFTPAQINASNFGVALWTEISGGEGVIYVDAVTMSVHYSRNGSNYSADIKYYIFEAPGT